MSLLKCVHVVWYNLYLAVPCTVMRFIETKEESCPRNLDAKGKVELTKEMIRETGAQFGVDLEDAQDNDPQCLC